MDSEDDSTDDEQRGERAEKPPHDVFIVRERPPANDPTAIAEPCCSNYGFPTVPFGPVGAGSPKLAVR